MTKTEYCVFNKSYSQQEYEQLCIKLVEHMKSTGEWGEFFPVEISPFGYDETIAQEYYPMSQQEVLERGWNWHGEKETVDTSAYPPLSIGQYDERVV